MKPELAVVSLPQDALMRRLSDEIEQHIKNVDLKSKARILFLPSYFMIPFTRLRDFVIASALKARGAEVISIETGTFHPEECLLFGGLYGHNRKSDLLEECRLESAILRDLLRLNPLELSQFRTKEDREVSAAYSSAVSIDNYRTLVRDGYPVGEKAAHVTMNMNNVGRMTNDAASLRQLKIHVANIVELQLAFEKVFDRVKPDAVVSNVPYYYRWGVPFYIAKARGIPFYSLGNTEKKNAVIFQYNSDALFDYSEAWPMIRDRDLSPEETRLADYAIKLRFDADVAYFQSQLGFAKAGADTPEKRDLFAKLAKHGGRTALFSTNMLCDAPVYQPCPAFESLPDMLRGVIEYFAANPQYQLVLKAHPGEKTFDEEHLKDVAKISSGNTLVSWIRESGIEIPDNVTVIDAYTKVAALDIIPHVDVGLCYSSSVALEMALLGKPMISTANAHYQGKDIMLQPQSRSEFFALLTERLMSDESEAVRESRRKLAKNYYLLSYGYASIDWGVLQGSDTFSVEDRLLINDAKLLLPGNNKALDYMCECIMGRLPVAGNGRMPPLTGAGLPIGG